MILFVAALLTVGAIAYTLLVRPKDIRETPLLSPTEALLERREQVLENIRDLEFEAGVGKVSEADFEKTSGELQKELDRLNSQIDDLEKGTPAAAPAPEPAPKNTCPSCGATFGLQMKFCGECGKPMVGGQSNAD